jgi:hypothetical protein
MWITYLRSKVLFTGVMTGQGDTSVEFQSRPSTVSEYVQNPITSKNGGDATPVKAVTPTTRRASAMVSPVENPLARRMSTQPKSAAKSNEISETSNSEYATTNEVTTAAEETVTEPNNE